MHASRPHVSAALSQLRHGVTVCALVVGTCAILQMLVFGFVHFTQARWEQPDQNGGVPAYSVVTGARSGGETAMRRFDDPTTAIAAPVPRVLSEWDAKLNTISDLAVTCGVISTVMLAVLCTLGVFIAGASAVPGVDRSVSAASWAIVMALGGLPWHDVMTSIPFPGVFGDYAGMTAMSDAVDTGGGSLLKLFVIYLLVPVAMLCAASIVLYRFRSGVAQGVIVTSVSEVDERLEREMAGIRARGVTSSTPRTVAALNQAIGDAPAAPAPVPTAPPAATIEPEAAPARKPGLFGRGNRSLFNHRRIGEPDAGDGLKRPI